MRNLLLVIIVFLSNIVYSQDSLFNKKLTEVTIRTVQRKNTDVAIINTVRNLPQISDAISSDFIKKTPDRNVADALKRVSGLTIQNDKFVVVRGLADRYNLAWLNNTSLPSTEPDRRAFSFDIIPTGVVDNIIVYKSPTANLPGDFSGGLVQVTTKEVTDKFFTINMGLGVGTLTTFNKFRLARPSVFPTTFPTTYTYRISSNGDKRLYTRQIENLLPQYTNALPNLNGGISFGLKSNKWNAVFSSTVRDSWAIAYTDRKDYQSSTELAYVYKDTLFTKRFTSSGLLNVTYLDGLKRMSWKTLVNYQNEGSFLFRTGDNFDNMQSVKSNAKNQLTTFVVNTQVEGKLKTVDFNFGWNYFFRDQPDYRVNPISKSLSTDEPYQIAWRDTYRFWSMLDEHTGNFTINKKINDYKIGGGYLRKWRAFDARVFRYQSDDMLDEITNNTDKYNADFDLANSYFMYDKGFGKWKLNTGLRGEYNRFKVGTADFSGQKLTINRQYLDFLPSLNLSYNLDKTKFRFSFSKTLARPEFREISNFAYYDFVRNAQILGNSNLEKTDIYNADLKWEVYPKSGENLFISVFGKRFNRPIEQIVADGSVPSNLLLTFNNPDKARLVGLELEWRKKVLSWLDFYTNASLMSSNVNVKGTNRQLQGQSNWIVNTGIILRKGHNMLNLTYNRVGDRISAVGFQGYPDIFENSRDVVDITILRKVGNNEIKLAIGDVLAQPSIYYQKTQNRQLIKTRNEATISLSINLTL